MEASSTPRAAQGHAPQLRAQRQGGAGVLWVHTSHKPQEGERAGQNIEKPAGLVHGRSRLDLRRGLGRSGAALLE
jgi:hypothetical protein